MKKVRQNTIKKSSRRAEVTEIKPGMVDFKGDFFPLPPLVSGGHGGRTRLSGLLYPTRNRTQRGTQQLPQGLITARGLPSSMPICCPRVVEMLHAFVALAF